jgi:hypothetical protein
MWFLRLRFRVYGLNGSHLNPATLSASLNPKEHHRNGVLRLFVARSFEVRWALVVVWACIPSFSFPACGILVHPSAGRAKAKGTSCRFLKVGDFQPTSVQSPMLPVLTACVLPLTAHTHCWQMCAPSESRSKILANRSSALF